MTNDNSEEIAEIEFPYTEEDAAFDDLVAEAFRRHEEEHKAYYESLDITGTKIYLVGGAVREIVRGFPDKVKDWDFAVEAESFLHMKKWLEDSGFHIFLETPQYFTIRARAPREGFTFAGMDMAGRTFDFALCRTDGEYSDGRRPDDVAVGTIESDLSRRDFTMNAIAMDASGKLVDPFGGQQDILRKEIRCVGSVERLREDSLRMLRALRFSIQLGFSLSPEVSIFLYIASNADLLDNVSEDRIRDELTKMFKCDTCESLYVLNSYDWLSTKIFSGDLWLMPTAKGK
jgi:tRNA nucleotidyltransferase (CCA-adding enzyme)